MSTNNEQAEPLPPAWCGPARRGDRTRKHTRSRTPDRGRAAAWLAVLLVLGTGPAKSVHAAEPPPYDAAEFDALMARLLEYGSTDTKRQAKQAAMAQLEARAPQTLRYLIDRVHVENMWFRILLDQLAERLCREKRGDVLITALMPALDSPRREARKYAAYFMGFVEGVRPGDRLLPLLDDPYTAAAAMRTLGKWHATNAVPRIVPYLRDDNERRRIAAANALRDIGDAAAIPALVAALGDNVCTVRKTAARALTTLGRPAGEALEHALPEAGGRARREMVRALGALKSAEAVPALRTLLNADDWGTRIDAARALQAIDPLRASAWITNTAAAADLNDSDAVRAPDL